MESKTGTRRSNPERTLTLSLEPGVDAPARARRAVASFADGPTDPALSFALELVASELVKNAVLYGSSEEAVLLELAGDSSEIELRVTNRGERIHMSGLRSHREDGGRGLEIVDALSLSWTITSGRLETSISVRMPLGSRGGGAGSGTRLACRGAGYDDGMPVRSRTLQLPFDRVAIGPGRV